MLLKLWKRGKQCPAVTEGRNLGLRTLIHGWPFLCVWVWRADYTVLFHIRESSIQGFWNQFPADAEGQLY